MALLLWGWDDRTGNAIVTNDRQNLPEDNSQVTPDPTNFDCTDFPRKGCRQCGKRDRPQWKGTCNDDHCSNP